MLNENQITNTGGIALAQALESNCSLTSLFLSNNFLGLYTVNAFIRLLKSNRSIVQLDLPRSLKILLEHAEKNQLALLLLLAECTNFPTSLLPIIFGYCYLCANCNTSY